MILDWNELVQKTIIAGSPASPPASNQFFAGSFNEQPLPLPTASRLLAQLNVAMYETVVLFQNASASAFDPYNSDGSCPARLGLSATTFCPRFVTLKDLGNGVPALAASYAAHFLLTSLYPLKAGSGGSSLTNLRFDNLLKNHQQWYNLQWSKAEVNPGWRIGFSKSANANTSTACPGQVGLCAAAVAAASNKTVTGASQNIGVAVATAVLAARMRDGFASWTPLSLSLNAPGALVPAATAGIYQPTVSNNYAAAVANQSFVTAATPSGDATSAVNRNADYGEAQLSFAPYGSAVAPGVRSYSLQPGFGSTVGFVVSPQAPTYAAAAIPVTPRPSPTPAERAAVTTGVFNAASGSYSDAQKSAFYWRLGSGSHGLPGHFNTVAAYLLNNATAATYSLLQVARLHAQLHTALHDATAAAWALKQVQLAPRPETDISATPGAWQPLLASPPYPSFPSAHATACSAAAAVLTSFFGGDAIPVSNGAPLSVTSSDSWQLGVSGSANAYLTAPAGANAITRSFTSFAALAADCGASRVAGGVQYSSSVTAGQALGAAVAADVLAAYPGALGTVAFPKVWAYLSYTPVVASHAPRAQAAASALLLAAAAAVALVLV